VLGIDVHVLKVKIFMLSAVLGAFAGSLFAHYVSFVSVDSFGVDRAINFLLLAVLGGAQTIWGTVLGALFITVTPRLLSRFGDMHAMLFAACLIAAVIFLPEGFGGALQRWLRRRDASGSRPEGG
jgi:branched-chain amino acid transport system permease protein